MKRCPEPLDLESFFGSAAATTDGKGGDWFYDHLSFTHVGQMSTTACTILPGEGKFSVHHVRDGEVFLQLNLEHVVTLDLGSSAGSRVLIGHLSVGPLERVFKLRLEPTFSFSLATGLPR
jgi:hypothetical protein